MKAKDIRELTDKEITARIKEVKDHLLRMRLNNAISAIESPSKIQESRRMLARLKTIIHERQNQKEISK